MKSVHFLINFTTVSGLAFLALGCGDRVTTSASALASSATQCQAQVAQLAVGDGNIQRLCGCQEDAGVAGPVIVAGTAVTCTVNSGTTVYFNYTATQDTHQISSSGTPSFASSPVSDPMTRSAISVHAVTFSTAGTYAFEDAYFRAISGQIVVK